MVLTSKAQSNLVGGVSQQPDALRLESQCRIQDNAYGTIIEGLKKRAPTKFVANLSAGANNYVNASYHWINRDPGEQYLLAVVPDGANTTIKAWDIDGTSVPVTFNVGLTAYLTHSAKSDFKWITVNDYTFLLNTYQPVSLAASQSPAQDQREAFIYVRQGNYKVNYKVDVVTASATAQASVSTWNGTAAGPTKEKWRVSVTQPASGSRLYSVAILGYTASYTGSSSETPAQIATGLRNAINASSGAADGLDDIVTASLPNISLGQVDIEADVAGVSFTPTVLLGAGTGGSITTTNLIQSSSLEYDSIKTDDIAEQIRTQIAAVSGFSATRSGSVVRVTHSSANITTINVTDSVGDTAAKGYFLTVDNFDELPPRCKDQTVLRVQGSVETAEDDFYVKFVTKVSGAFDEGEWRETIQPDRQKILSNMPLSITRLPDTGSGISFYVDVYPWAECLVGGSDSNPPPSFVGAKITDIFFHKNRLGILTESSIVLSEAGVYGNFWRTTVRQLLDSDPIDIQASHTSVAKLQYAVPISEQLVVFSETAQFILSGDPLLTPKTASFQFVSAYTADMGVSPTPAGRNVYFVANKSGYASVWEYQQILENVTAGSYQSNNISTQIPQYIPQGVNSISANTAEEVFALRSSQNPLSLYIWKYFINGNQIIQSAWSRFTFAQQILSAEFYDNTLYMVTKLGSDYYIETLDFGFGTSNVNPLSEPLLDHQLELTTTNGVSASYNAGTNTTTVTLPAAYPYASSWTNVVVCTAGGDVLTPTRLSNTQFTLSGQYSVDSGLVIGSNYEMRYQFGRVDIREETPQGGRFGVTVGRYQNLYGILKYSKTKTFTVTTQIQQEAVKSLVFESSLGNDESGTIKLDNGEFRFPTLSKSSNLTIEIKNSTPFPCTILGAEWIANFTTNFQRIRQ